MASLFERLRATGGPIQVAVLDGQMLVIFVMARMQPTKGRHALPSVEDDDRFPMDPDMSVGIVLDYLRLRDRPILCHEASPTVRLELVERLPAPADARHSGDGDREVTRLAAG